MNRAWGLPSYYSSGFLTSAGSSSSGSVFYDYYWGTAANAKRLLKLSQLRPLPGNEYPFISIRYLKA
jgi:hypothetical protein